MNGMGAYIKTRDSFFQIPRMTYEEWKLKKGKESAE
jgi:hypothetical protein